MKDGKYICSCDTFIRDGIVCRHIFALSNIHQEKTLVKFIIHKRWHSPLADSNEFNFKIDNYSFDSKQFSQYLDQNIIPIEKEEQKEEKGNVFKVVKQTKGAPKKDKRLKSANEKKTGKEKRSKKYFLFLLIKKK